MVRAVQYRAGDHNELVSLQLLHVSFSVTVN